MLLEQSVKPLPGQATTLTAAAQPLVPDPLRRFDEQLQTSKVAVHAEVVEVSPESPCERGLLVLDPTGADGVDTSRGRTEWPVVDEQTVSCTPSSTVPAGSVPSTR